MLPGLSQSRKNHTRGWHQLWLLRDLVFVGARQVHGLMVIDRVTKEQIQILFHVNYTYCYERGNSLRPGVAYLTVLMATANSGLAAGFEFVHVISINDTGTYQVVEVGKASVDKIPLSTWPVAYSVQHLPELGRYFQEVSRALSDIKGLAIKIWESAVRWFKKSHV